ncbi:hypothetical protein F7C95_05670 [Opitutia bacterium ISCC 51]|nr:hypothetical protein F7C95_05670 [Opitutae bacterium ISCC 51]QXD29454.1 hypothetical protein GA003_05640 [Opitutae bacterium ISCC 52]
MKRFYDMKESEMQKGGTNYWLSKLSDLLTRWTMMKGRAIKRIEQCKASGGSGPAAIQQSTKAETAHQISLQVKQLEDLMLEHKERFFFNMQWDPPEKAAEYRSMKEKLEIHKRRLAGI